ncbi:hypothetical protein MMC28_001254 [Mycoblastus sanguinarius]|nr:hypothetical protein [Mycoblastus sanguinarius]
MPAHSSFPQVGGCDCGKVRYKMASQPLFINCCHCRWCQRECGSAFATNAIIEADRLISSGAEPIYISTPTESGKPQHIARCPDCSVAVWSIYASGLGMRCVRAGTLDNPSCLSPDIHICTNSKLPWVVLPPDVPAVGGLYDAEQYWPAESLQRRDALLGASK